MVVVSVMSCEQVHLTWSTLQAAPGENVSLHVSASEARAYVGLLVVDKSVLLLKEGNDVTKEKVKATAPHSL